MNITPYHFFLYLSVYQVAWSADSQFLVSCSKDSTIKLWSVKNTKKALHTLPGHEDEVRAFIIDWRGFVFCCIALSIIAFYHAISTSTTCFSFLYLFTCLLILHLTSSLPPFNLPSLNVSPLTLPSLHLPSLHPSPSTLSSCHPFSHHPSLSTPFTLPSHHQIYTVDWSPNGSQVASGSKDRTIKIWHH